MSNQIQLVTYTIKVDGQKQDNIEDELLEVTVDTALFMPGMFTMQVHDYDPTNPANTFQKTNKYKLGAQIEISVGYNKTEKPIFTGVITGHEYLVSSDGSIILTVRGYDETYKLTQGKHIRSFQKASDSDMAKKVIQEAGLTPTFDTDSNKYEVFIQYNQSDWDFILSRARRMGHIVISDGKKLLSKKPTGKSSSAIDLELGRNLITFSPSLSALGQLTKTIARGWDPKQKKEIVGQSTVSDPQDHHSITAGKGAAAAKKLRSADITDYNVSQLPFVSAAHAKSIAEARLNNAESQFVRADMVAVGDNRFKAGEVVNITKTGDFSGKYMLTHVRHHLTHGNYTCSASVHGGAIDSLAVILNPETSGVVERIDGVAIGLVTNLNDPDKAGRVKIKYPWLPSDDSSEIESDWVRIVSPGGGNETGFFFMPEVNDEVLVAFEFGDINSPYIIGGLYNGKDKPPNNSTAVANGKINQRVVRTRSGHTITFSDESGKESILIQDKSQKNKILLDTAQKSITMKAEGDIILEAGGKLTMTSQQAFALESKSAAGSITTGAGMNVEAKAKATIKGSAGTAIEGATVDINGQTKTTVKGAAMVEISGGIVKIN